MDEDEQKPRRFQIDDGHKLSKKKAYIVGEDALDVPSSKKGKGVYCSLVMIAFTAITVCVLLTAAVLMAYYIPLNNQEVQMHTKASSQASSQAPTQPPTQAPTPTQAPIDTPTQAPLDFAQIMMQGRLPKTVLPRRYEVRLRPFLYEDDVEYSKLKKRFTFDGWVTIKVECIQPTDEITLHSKNLKFHANPTVTSVSSLDKTTNLLASYEMVTKYAFIVLKLNRALDPNQEYNIYFEYSGILADDRTGFYPNQYVDTLNETRYIATTQMQPTSARQALPCFDEPSFKATFDVQLEHRSNMQALSNGMETKTETIDGHWSRTFFETVHFMPTYLLAFIVHDYSYINVTSDHGCLIRVWCRWDKVNLGFYALNVSNLVQTYFDNYLDLQYPLAKQDHIAIPQMFLDGMENWGLITYQEGLLLYGLYGYASPLRYSTLITHEVAHQWFGNLVTLEWWDDMWLNEGFATYMEHVGMDFVNPAFRTYEMFYENTMRIALNSDSDGVVAALRHPVDTNRMNIILKFLGAYNKGASILWMLEHFLGIDVFNQGIRSYLKERAYKNANAEHLWRELTKADETVGQHDVKLIMDTWTLQRGYPLVNMTRSEDGRQIEVTQAIFLKLGQILEKDKFGDLGYKWYVPLTYVYKSGPPDFDNPLRTMLEPTEDSTTITLPVSASSDDWYLANVKMNGYYRVNYDDDNWQRLLKQAEKDPDVFSEENKIGLVYDSEQLVLAGLINVSIYQGFSSSLGQNTLVARRAVVRSASHSARMLMGRRHAIHRRSTPYTVQTYMQQLVDPLYAEFGWDQDFVPALSQLSGGLETGGQFDVTSAACQYAHDHCVSKATDLFQEYMNNPSSDKIPANFRQVVYCNGIRFGGRKEWNFAWTMLQSGKDPRERSCWVSALTCSKDSSRLQSYLISMSDQIAFDHRDAVLILAGIAENLNGYEIAWDFVRNNWEKLEKVFLGSYQPLCNIFEKITSYFNTEEELQELLDFGRNHNVDALLYTYDEAVISTKVNIRWMRDNAANMQEWFASLI